MIRKILDIMCHFITQQNFICIIMLQFFKHFIEIDFQIYLGLIDLTLFSL